MKHLHTIEYSFAFAKVMLNIWASLLIVLIKNAYSERITHTSITSSRDRNSVNSLWNFKILNYVRFHIVKSSIFIMGAPILPIYARKHDSNVHLITPHWMRCDEVNVRFLKWIALNGNKIVFTREKIKSLMRRASSNIEFRVLFAFSVAHRLCFLSLGNLTFDRNQKLQVIINNFPKKISIYSFVGMR